MHKFNIILLGETLMQFVCLFVKIVKHDAYLTNRFYYCVAEHGDCHGMVRRMQALYAVKVPVLW
jgi:hypothetical protein